MMMKAMPSMEIGRMEKSMMEKSAIKPDKASLSYRIKMMNEELMFIRRRLSNIEDAFLIEGCGPDPSGSMPEKSATGILVDVDVTVNLISDCNQCVSRIESLLGLPDDR